MRGKSRGRGEGEGSEKREGGTREDEQGGLQGKALQRTGGRSHGRQRKMWVRSSARRRRHRASAFPLQPIRGVSSQYRFNSDVSPREQPCRFQGRHHMLGVDPTSSLRRLSSPATRHSPHARDRTPHSLRRCEGAAPSVRRWPVTSGLVQRRQRGVRPS